MGKQISTDKTFRARNKHDQREIKHAQSKARDPTRRMSRNTANKTLLRSPIQLVIVIEETDGIHQFSNLSCFPEDIHLIDTVTPECHAIQTIKTSHISFPTDRQYLNVPMIPIYC